MSKEKPILFNTQMVNAILEGRKTQTRRIIKPQPPEWCGQFGYSIFTPGGCISARGISNEGFGETFIKLPYQRGDILWVRETWKKYQKRVGSGDDCYIAEFYGYKADEDNSNNPSEFYEGNWKPSIHMPKEAARIFLKVTDVKVERLQSMKFSDLRNEGITEKFPPHAADEFHKLWDSTLKKYQLEQFGFNANPWVWVIEFEKLEGYNE